MAVTVPDVVLRPLLRVIARWMCAPAPSWPAIRDRERRLTARLRPPATVSVTTTQLGGVPVEVLTPADALDDAALLYFHGGGYALGSPRGHRALVGRLAVALGVPAYVVEYRLLPEHPYPAALDDVLAAYRALLGEGHLPGRIAVAGDSAGGGLTLALALAARESGLAQPGVLGFLCPAVDMTPQALAALPVTRGEPVLIPALVDLVAGVLARPGEEPHPMLSPLNGDLAGLPPMVVDGAGADPIVGQARELVTRARAAGVRVRYHEYPGRTHVFQGLLGMVAEADRALADFAHELGRELRQGAAVDEEQA